MTRAEVAERANLSDRTYADIERGSSNMRAETLIGICNALHITPNEIFVDTEAALDVQQEEMFNRLNECSARERETALKLIEVYLDSLNKWGLSFGKSKHQPKRIGRSPNGNCPSAIQLQITAP